MQSIYQKYAHLLVNYCVEVRPGDKVYVKSSTAAEPLLREVYREALKAGALVVDFDIDFLEKDRIMLENASDEALGQVPLLYKTAVQDYDCYLYIRAPHNLREMQNAPTERSKLRSAATKPFHKIYFERTGSRELRRNLCQFPTQASAQQAGMSLEEYENFVFTACKLDQPDPIAAWKALHDEQQRIVDLLNAATDVHYKGKHVDLKFSTKGRTWINSDGQTNMPSGEVYTSPVEDSVNGTIFYTYPGLYGGHEVENIRLHVKDGFIESWEATRGKDYLDKVFALEGTRRFGEAAIGTNYSIDKMTKNILFDEKIGGTVHLAIGQSYLQCGGKNESTVHWDMITDMTEDGEIYADGELMYKNGKFLV